MLMAKDVSEALCKRTDEVVRHLLPNGKKQGNEWCAGDIRGSAGDSLKVHLSGDKSGIWCDFATGQGGDLLDLWALNRSISLLEAIKAAARYLGMPSTKLSGQRSLKFAKPKPEIVKPISEQMDVVHYLKERGLNQETINRFRIGQRNGDVVFPYFVGNELVSAKYLKLKRENGKKSMYVEKDCEPCLFGWQALNNTVRQITICEGEIDAMSLHQYGIEALSVPFGGGSGKKHEWIEFEYERLSIFDEIYLCMDNDEEGQIAAKEILGRLGQHRCKIVELPLKDANECLTSGISSDDMQHFFSQAITIDPMELKDAIVASSKVREWINPVDGKHDGYLAPWPKTQKHVLFRPYEFSVWTGINGHGKSQFLGHIVLDMMKQGARVCLASLELRPEIFLGRLAKQAAAMENPSNEYIDCIMNWMSGRLWYIDVLGKIDITRLLEVFQYGLRRYGIDVFIIDSFMMLNGVYEDDFKSQKKCIEQLCEFKNQNYCQVHMVVHPRKPVDEKMVPGKLDAKGSGSITDAADNCFCVWRNKEKEILLEKQTKGIMLTDKELEKIDYPDGFWKCDKQRNGMWEGLFGMWYDKGSFQYLEYEDKKPIRYVNYAKDGRQEV